MKPIENMVTCPACNGSGEGMYQGSRCFHCKGIGEVLNLDDPDDSVEYEKDADVDDA